MATLLTDSKHHESTELCKKNFTFSSPYATISYTMLTLLQNIGLPDREARVYLAALELGKGSIDKIAKSAGLQRTTAYNHVESLMKKGLMTTITENKRTYYMAESPEHLIKYVDQQKQQLEASKDDINAALPSLLTKFNQDGSKPVVRMFSGVDGVRTMREEVLKMQGSELLVVTSFNNFYSVFRDEEERVNYTRRRVRKKITAKVLYTFDEELEIGKLHRKGDEFRKIDNTVFPVDFDIYIFDNSVAITSFTDNPWSVMIEGRAVADSMRMMFMMAWEFNAIGK